MIFWKKLSTAGNTCRHERLLNGIRHQISKFHFYVLWVFVSSSTWYGLVGENTRRIAKRFKPFHAVKEIFTNIIIPSLPAESVLSCFGWLERSSPSSTCWSCNLRWAGWLRRWLALWWGHRYLPTRTHSHTQLDGQTTFPWSKNQWSSYSTWRPCSTTCTKGKLKMLVVPYWLLV